MRISNLYKPPQQNAEAEHVPRSRLVAWCLIAAVLFAGVALYFLYGRGVAPLL